MNLLSSLSQLSWLKYFFKSFRGAWSLVKSFQLQQHGIQTKSWKKTKTIFYQNPAWLPPWLEWFKHCRKQ